MERREFLTLTGVAAVATVSTILPDSIPISDPIGSNPIYQIEKIRGKIVHYRVVAPNGTYQVMRLDEILVQINDGFAVHLGNNQIQFIS